MKNLIALGLLILIAYFVYTSGILSRSVQTQPNTDATPEIFVTVYSPYGTGSRSPTPRADIATSTLPPVATSTPVSEGAAPNEPAVLSTATPLPAVGDTPTLPSVATPTLPPPTIILPSPAPTLAVANTPTPSSSFTMTIETPHDGETIRFAPVQVIGQTSPGAVVSANDTVGIANAEGRFSLAVPLQEGPNVLEVVASNSSGEQVYAILTVLYQP